MLSMYCSLQFLSQDCQIIVNISLLTDISITEVQMLLRQWQELSCIYHQRCVNKDRMIQAAICGVLAVSCMSQLHEHLLLVLTLVLSYACCLLTKALVIQILFIIIFLSNAHKVDHLYNDLDCCIAHPDFTFQYNFMGMTIHLALGLARKPPSPLPEGYSTELKETVSQLLNVEPK